MHYKAWKCWYYKLKGVLQMFYGCFTNVIRCFMVTIEDQKQEKNYCLSLNYFFFHFNIFFWTRVCLLYPHVYHSLRVTFLHFWSRDTQKRTIYSMKSLSVVTYTLGFDCLCLGSSNWGLVHFRYWRYALWKITRFSGIPKYIANAIFPFNHMHQRQTLIMTKRKIFNLRNEFCIFMFLLIRY